MVNWGVPHSSLRLASSAAGSQPTVRIACRLMLAGAVLEIVAAITGMRTESSTRAALAAGSRPRPDAAALQDLVTAHGETILATSLTAAVIWLAMAYANRQGGTIARGISAFLFVAGTRSALEAFHDPNSAATLTIAVVIWLVGLAAIALLFIGPAQLLIERAAKRRVTEQRPAPPQAPVQSA
jgi:hypothetical protein